MKYGLSDNQLQEIIDFIAQNHDVEEAVIFGSRAIDTFKEASDIDIALKGEKVNHALVAKMKFNIEEDSYLPFFFDFVAYPTITNEELRKHIDTKGVAIYRKGEDSMGEWKESFLDEIAFINPTERLAKGQPAKKIAMELLMPFTKRVTGYSVEPFNGGMKFRNGDTIVARITPCLENGKTAFIDVLDEDEIGFGSTEYIVLRERKGISNKQFLYYFAISDEFRDVAILAMTGSSGRQRVETDVVRNHRFFLPPLPEQRAIAGVLSSLDDKIDLLHRQNKTLEAMAETLFRQWFVEEADEGWEEVLLGDFFPVVTGKKDANFGTEDGPYPFFTCSQTPIKAPSYSFDGSAILLAGNGDFSIKRYIGKFEAYQRTYVLIPYDVNYFGFLYTIMKYFLSEITGGFRGSVINFITKGMITDFRFNLPKDRSCLNEKLFQFNQLFEKVDSNANQIRTLEKLRDALLPKLMNGEVRVEVGSHAEAQGSRRER